MPSNNKPSAYETEAQPLPEVVISSPTKNNNPSSSSSPNPTTPGFNSPPPYISMPDSLTHNTMQEIQPVQDAPIHPSSPSPVAVASPLHPQPHPHPQQIIYTQYGIATPLASVGQTPTPVDCPVCGQRQMTRVDPHSGNTTHGWAAVACICVCLPCIPYLITSLKDVDHLCGHCGVRLVTWHSSGRVVVHQSQQQMPTTFQYQIPSQVLTQSQLPSQSQYQSPGRVKHTGSHGNDQDSAKKSPAVTGS